MNDCNNINRDIKIEAIYTKGEDGKDGVDGKDGQDGYTPIKGVDYFDGAKGETGTGILSVVANEDASITVTLTDGSTQTTEPLIDTSYSGVYSSTEW